jgi:hypothetical protein
VVDFIANKAPGNVKMCEENLDLKVSVHLYDYNILEYVATYVKLLKRNIIELLFLVQTYIPVPLFST